MDIYSLSRNFWDYSFENPDKIKPNHIAMYFFAIEHCNRLGWKEKFGFPTSMVMDAISIKSYNTYIKTLTELVDFGFLKMIEKSKNQYSSNIIAISNNDKANNKALDKALIKHSTKQDESTAQSIDSIDIPIYKETNIQDRFSQIKNLSDYLKSYKSDKRYLFIAYKFWELWRDESPGDQTLQKAKVFNWSDEVRKMVEIDKTSIERLLAIYSYFSKCDTKGFDRFWFENIQSMAGLRGKNKNQEYKIDKIIKLVNAKIQSDDEFSNYLNSIIDKFNTYESLKPS